MDPKESNRLRDKIIEIIEDKCFAENKRETPTPLSAVYPLLHFFESEMHEYGKHLQGRVLDLTDQLHDKTSLCEIQQEIIEDNGERLDSAVKDGHELLKSNEAKDETIERLENELSEAVEIMGAIYDNVDKYHLDFAFAGGECYDRLKEYLGV